LKIAEYSDTKEIFCFTINDTNKKFHVYKTLEDDVEDFVLLADASSNILDTFYVSACSHFHVVQIKDKFIDLYVYPRSPTSKQECITRLAILNEKLVPIYQYEPFFITKWKDYSRDLNADIIARTELQSYEFLVNENDLDLPNEMRLIQTSYRIKWDTMGHVMQADTSFTQTRLIRDQRTGVYMERYLNHEEIQQANRVFDTDSIPMLRGAFYYKGQWDY
jgi:hypothetical protein